MCSLQEHRNKPPWKRQFPAEISLDSFNSNIYEFFQFIYRKKLVNDKLLSRRRFWKIHGRRNKTIFRRDQRDNTDYQSLNKQTCTKYTRQRRKKTGVRRVSIRRKAEIFFFFVAILLLFLTYI